jgi:predicted SAM-dependent methyltransferase
MKLNLGSGKRNREGFINIDAVKQTDSTIVGNILNLDYEDGTIEHIYSSHVIEHLDKNEIKRYFSECHRMLIPNGIMELLAPSMLLIIKQFNNGKVDINYLDNFLYALQLHPYDYHKHGIYDEKLRKLCADYGFKISQISYNDIPREPEIYMLANKI